MKPLDLIIVCVLIFWLGCVEKMEKHPLLEVSNPKVDLGKLPFDSSATVTYHLLNAGSGELIIDTATASCDCTIPILNTKRIMPGDSAILEVRFKPVDTGNFEKKVVIKSNVAGSFSIVSFKGQAIK